MASGALFQRWRFLVTGVGPPPLDLDFRAESRGYLIENQAALPLAGVWLLHQGCAWPLGPLPAGETRWDPPPRPDPSSRETAEPGTTCSGLPAPSAPPLDLAPALLVRLAPDRWPATIPAQIRGTATETWLLVYPTETRP